MMYVLLLTDLPKGLTKDNLITFFSNFGSVFDVIDHDDDDDDMSVIMENEEETLNILNQKDLWVYDGKKFSIEMTSDEFTIHSSEFPFNFEFGYLYCKNHGSLLRYGDGFHDHGCYYGHCLYCILSGCIDIDEEWDSRSELMERAARIIDAGHRDALDGIDFKPKYTGNGSLFSTPFQHCICDLYEQGKSYYIDSS